MPWSCALDSALESLGVIQQPRPNSFGHFMEFNRTSRWGAALSLASTAATSATAAVVFTPLDVPLTISAGGNIYFDPVTGDAGFSSLPSAIWFNFSADQGGNTTSQKPAVRGWNALAAQIAVYPSTSTTYSAGLAENLGFGDSIDSGLNWTSTGAKANINRNGANNSDWAAGTRGYVAYRINSNDPSPLYGWADVEYEEDLQLTLFGFAYNNAGGSILAGEIPEAGANPWILAAVTAGSVAAYRRRRQRSAVHA